MNWERFFTTPPPATAWDLGAADIAVVHRTGQSEFHCAAEDVPAGTFEVGPVGLQAYLDQLKGIYGRWLQPRHRQLKVLQIKS